MYVNMIQYYVNLRNNTANMRLLIIHLAYPKVIFHVDINKLPVNIIMFSCLLCIMLTLCYLAYGRNMAPYVPYRFSKTFYTCFYSRVQIENYNNSAYFFLRYKTLFKGNNQQVMFLKKQ